MRLYTMPWDCPWYGNNALMKAVEELRLAATLSPENVRYIYVYAVALNSTGKPEQAVMVLQGAHNQHPNNREILSALMAFHRDMGNQAAAQSYAREIARNITLKLFHCWHDKFGITTDAGWPA